VTIGQHPAPTDLVLKVLNLIETISGKSVISMPLNWSYKTSLVMGGLILIVGFCMVAIKQL
jgi:hypothetical protein